MKSEFMVAYELPGKVLRVAQRVGGFIKEHVVCGAWGGVAEEMHVPRKPQAHIEYWSTPESVIKGEE